jgi:molybdopterin/thiamine biosynthesis adenylyltransferase/rhodanese-related sulfurtransferase
MGSILSSAEMARYARHITIPEFGVAGQEKLKQAKVLVIGSGGLGSPVLLYLAAAGVGHIGIVDFDVVDDSNLQRQVLFTVEDIGKSKAETAKKRLEALNPYINITVYNTAFTKDNALDIIKDYDIVADGTDNFPTRYLVNDACVLAGKVNVYGSIFRFEGQVSVFNFLKEDGTRGPNYRHMFPEPPPPGLVPNCAEGGVLGVLPGIIGSLQASEVIKVITGVGQPLVGKLFLFDVAAFETRTLKINTQQNIEITELINYESFCGLDIEEEPVKEVTVRESFEYEIANIGGKLIPLSTVKDNLDKISKTKQVIIHCKSGARSTNAIKELEELYPFDNLYNLKGGILAYANEIDDRIPVY